MYPDPLRTKIFLYILLLLAGILPNSLYCQTSYDVIYATDNDEEMFDAILHSSGNIYLSGRTRIPGTNNMFPLLMKIDETGGLEVLEWSHLDTIGHFPQLLEMDNGNIMLIGQYGLISGNETDQRWIRIIDPGLNFVSDHFFSQDTSYISVYQNNAVIDSYGEVAVLGTVEMNSINPGYTTLDFYMAKYSQDGHSRGFQVYPFENHSEQVFDLTCIPGTDEYLAITSAFFIGMPYPQLVRISHSLEILSHIWYTGSVDLHSPCVPSRWINNSTFLITAVEPEWLGNDDQFAVHKSDMNAQISKSLIMGKPDTCDYSGWFNNTVYVNDSTIYVGGFMNYITFWTLQPALVELYLIDTNLNILGYRQFGGDMNYMLNGITSTSDGGCLLYASAYSDTNEYQRDVHIFKVPRDSIQIITSFHELPNDCLQLSTVYPDPVRDVLNIPLDDYIDYINIQVYGINGKKVLDVEMEGTGNLITLNIQNLISGVYVFNVSSAGSCISSGKFIKR